MESNIEQQIRIILQSIERPNSNHGDIDTCTTLYDLALMAEWTSAELEIIDFLSKRFDINKKLFLGYFNNGRKAVNTELTEQVWLELMICILFKAIFMTQTEFPIKLKRFNVLFKALDVFTPSWLTADSELTQVLESTWFSLLNSLPLHIESLKITKPKISTIHIEPQEIPLTVLFYEGPIARAYLATIKSLGFMPQKIIELVAAKDIATKKPVGKLLPKGMRLFYAASIQRNKIHYWPKQLQNSDLVSSIRAEVTSQLKFTKTVIDNANAILPLSEYSNNIESLLIDSLSDAKLLSYLSNESKGAILFTGGGIVPKSLLSLTHIKFLHIHPGFLPNIRGADCVLWSTLLTDHPSATCFYMSPDIDAGDIILPCWLPKLTIKAQNKDVEPKSQYRAIYAYLDPWVRAFVLREVLKTNINKLDKLDELTSFSQKEEQGITFHFMHPRIIDVSQNK